MARSVNVFRADDSHFADLIALRYRWRTEEAGENGDGLENFDRRFRTRFEEQKGSHYGYLLTVDQVPVGCAWLVVIHRVPGPEVFVRRAGIVQSVFLLPGFRNQKLGATMMKALILEARSMGLSYLTTHPSKKSTSFYKRLGFENADAALELRLDITE